MGGESCADDVVDAEFRQRVRTGT